VVFAVMDEILIDFGQLREVFYGLLIIVLFLGFRRGAVPDAVDFVRPFLQRVAARTKR